jgi:hypothetical protein
MKVLRVLVTIALGCLLLGSLWLTCHSPKPPSKIELLDLKSETFTLYQQAKNDTDQFFQLGIIVLGGLWTVTIVNKDTRIRRGDWLETIWLAVTCLLFLSFFVFYQDYRALFGDMTTDFFKMNKLPDPTDPYVKLQAMRVARFFYIAVLSSGVTVLGLCMKRNADKEVKQECGGTV